MKIKYVGSKDDGETAFSREPGAPAIWLKGDSHEVSETLAKRMLQHPDVFAMDDDSAIKAKDKPKANQETADEFSGLTKEQLHAMAKELGVEVHHAAGAAKVTEALRAATTTKEPAQ